MAKPPKAPVNHPPYAEMIVSAIRSLNEKAGSSKTAIAKYIDSSYSNLPPTHSALLTHHLKRLKKKGIVLMVKHSYKLATASGAAPPPTRGRGRPPKSKTITAVVATGGPVVKRARGRPPMKVLKPKPIKAVGSGVGLAKRGRGRPPKVVKPNTGAVVVGKRGRPKKNSNDNPPPPPPPPLVISVLGVASEVVVSPIVVARGRPRGRRAKVVVEGVTKPKSERPVGRPRKVGATTPTPPPKSVV